MKRKMIASVLPLMMVLAAMFLFTGAVYADAFDWESGSDTDVTYDSNHCPGDEIFTATDFIVKAESSDPSVFSANIECPKNIVFTENYRSSDHGEYYLGADEKQVQIMPKGVGTATLTVENSDGKTLTKTITVEEDYFEAYLNTSAEYPTFKGKPGILHDEYDDNDYLFIKNVIGYGQSEIEVYSVEGTKVSLKLKGKTYKGTTGSNGTVDLKKINSKYKLGTKGTLTLTFGPASVKRTVKIVSVTKIWPNKIKAKAKKGSVKITVATKGDKIKVKIGKKTVKTVKVKKSKGVYTVKFKSKKKLKKRTKITYIVTNKYKQKLAKKTYKVGSKGNPYYGGYWYY